MRQTRPSPPRPSRLARAGRATRRWFRRGLLLSALAVALGASAQGGAGRIAYVDMQRLLDNAPQVAAGRAALQAEFAQRDAALKTEENRLAQLEARQRRDAAILPKDAADALALEIETLRRSIKRMRDKLREDLSARSGEELNRRWPEIHDAVIAYAREQRIDIVVQSPVIYASPAVDITDEVLERLQREFGAAGDAR